MTFGYSIDQSRGLILMRMAGSVNATEFIACMEKLWGDPAYRKEYEGVADITGLRGDHTLEDLRRVTEFLRDNPNIGVARWAVVATSPLVVASAYLYQRTVAPAHCVEVFSTWEAAAGFIGLDRPAFAAAV